jgi:hypothetical protein
VRRSARHLFRGIYFQFQAARRSEDILRLRRQTLDGIAAFRLLRQPQRYFFFPVFAVGCHPPAFWLGAAAIVLILSFFGFLVSRLLFCSPLAMSISPAL